MVESRAYRLEEDVNTSEGWAAATKGRFELVALNVNGNGEIVDIEGDKVDVEEVGSDESYQGIQKYGSVYDAMKALAKGFPGKLEGRVGFTVGALNMDWDWPRRPVKYYRFKS